MKKIAILMIGLYQTTVSPIIKTVFGVNCSCRLSPSCSEYAKKAINQHGLFKGGKMAALRIISCRP